tara:strand:+ start:78 stop:1964 length:1887 start_codon:yes stop_codon:yes gene_type:complete
MPRIRLPQVQTLKDSSFEPKRKNPISLADDSFLDEHFKPLRIGEDVSPLSFSKDEIRIDGDLHLEGKLANPLLTTDFEYLELRAEENIRFTSNNSTGSLDIFVSGGSPFYVASGNNMYFTTTGAGLMNFGSLGTSLDVVKFDTLNGKIQITNPSDSGDVFTMDVDNHAETTISTLDNSATAGHLTLDADGDINIDAATGNITVKDNGGNYTPSSDYHIATKKYVDDNAGGGASALNDLSDVTYSSGDLTISSLDTIVAGGDLILDVTGDITLDAFGKQVYISRGGTNSFLFDMNSELFRMISSLNSDDYFQIAIGSEGATTISTVDADTTAADLTLDIDGDINLDADGGLINLKDGGTTFGLFTTTGNKSGFILYESAGASTDDFFALSVGANGAVLCATTDDGGASADLTFRIDGDITLNSTTGNIITLDDGGTYTPSADSHVATKKYVDDNAGGTQKFSFDYFYIFANLSSTNTFFANTHIDDFGVSSLINTGITDYNDTEHSDIWRVTRHAKRIPFNGTITKVITHVESTGASADSDIEVGVWIASISDLSLDTQLAASTNVAIDNLAKIDFDFDTATRFIFKETTSFNATSLTQGDFMFVTLRRTSGTDGSSFNCHTTILMDVS